MATDPIAAYQDALRNIDAQTTKTERLVQIVVRAGAMLQQDNWKQVSFSNVGIQFPIEVSRSPYTINAQEWPTAQELAQALADWHSIRHAADNAWRAIPPDRQTGLQPPPPR